MLKAIILMAIITAAMALIGWLTFSNGTSQTVITIDKQRVREDVHNAVEKVEQLTEELQERVEESTHQPGNSGTLVP